MRILFVCTGNICRSPTAEGVLRSLAAARGLDGRITIDSAGTHEYHIGEPPDPRAIAAAKRRGIDLSALRARRIAPGDFESFDRIVAMDRGHLSILRRRCLPARAQCLRLFMSYLPELSLEDVPDPYYGRPEDFELVLDLAERGGRAILSEVERELDEGRARGD